MGLRLILRVQRTGDDNESNRNDGRAEGRAHPPEELLGLQLGLFQVGACQLPALPTTEQASEK
jgi:hypothetical protein